MGIQFFSRIAIPHLLITMKFLSTLCLAASASAMALEDTADVKAAKADFAAAFAAAEAGEHAALAPAQGPAVYLDDTADVAAAKAKFGSLTPVQGPTAYLADAADVAAAKADFAAAFAAAEAGEHAALAPKPVEALPAPALPAYAAPFYAGFYNGVYPYAAGYYGGYYPYAGYGAYPYAFAPYTYAVAPAAKEE